MNLREQFAKLDKKFGELAQTEYRKDMALRLIAESPMEVFSAMIAQKALEAK